MPLTDSALEELKHARPAECAAAVPDLIRNRWSPRAFLDRPVSDADLCAVLTAASWAPSSYNEQPWRFFVGRAGDATHEQLLAALGEFNRVWARKAPVLLLSIARRNFTHSGEPNRFALHDAGAAWATLALCATTLGLHTHAMAGFDPAAAREALAVPEEFEIGAMIALGYFGDHAALDGALLERETMERKRKPLADVVFAGAFGQSAKL